MLSDKQKKFCEEYLTDFNASKAASRAGYSSKNSHLLSNPEIKAYITEIISGKLKSTDNLSADRLIRELESIAFADDVKISGRDKIRAIELLGKTSGIFDNPKNPEADKNLRALMEALKENDVQ